MNPFLYYVAKDLIERFGNNLSQVTIVFPGKRAELYMNYFLSHIAKGPVWAPRFITIDDLFQQFSDFTPCDNILCICRLYNIYASLVQDPQSLDDFYGWGEILMNDFDDIDKHLVDADKLFANGADLAAMDRVDFLSEEQIKALRQFFLNFEPDHLTDLKQHFLEMWKAMPEMYRRLKEELRKDGLMYKGALYREVAERVKGVIGRPKGLRLQSEMGQEGVRVIQPSPLYAFVGFNVLDEVEETMFSALRDAGKALFYWDYDTYYISAQSDHEAGLFLRHNLKLYPNALPDDIYNCLISTDKDIQILSTTTDNAQVRYLTQWLGEGKGRRDNQTAIVLCDEALMRSAMHAIPDEAKVNITMGFPLTDTAVHGYFSALLDLQTDGYDEELKRFRPVALERVEKNPFFSSFPKDNLPLQHPTDNLSLIDWLIAAVEALGKQLAQCQTPTPYDQLYAEATFQLYRTLGQFRWLIADGTLDIRPTTLRRLIRQALQSASIPFHGDMDEGVQMMGLLEARNLDFRHLIVLAVGEGIIPRRSNDTSFIPYILRAHFGLDTTERQDSVYAYSFYRLLQRAQDITLLYNGNSSGIAQREQSRFLRQLLTETPLPIRQAAISSPAPFALQHPIVVEKDERVMDILYAKRHLSPTAINQYVDCPLRFYYQQVAHLRMPDRPQDGIDPPRFGNIFHNACELFYFRLTEQTGRKEVQPTDLDKYIKHPATLLPFIDEAFAHELQIGIDDLRFTGLNMIIRDVILQLMGQLLRWDREHAPFLIYGMEQDHYTDITIPSNGRSVTLSVGGRIDRLDIMPINGCPTLRVVDYKTGHSKSGPSTVEGIFDGQPTNAHGYYLQTFLYSVIMARKQPLPVAPCLFYVLSATDARQYNPMLKLNKEYVTDIRDLADDYMDGLRRILTEIYDPARPFVQTGDRQNHCSFCDFRRFCGR